MESDAIYFARRAMEERAAAGQAPHPTARQAHNDMADRYDELSAAIVARESRLGIGVSALPESMREMEMAPRA